MTDFPKSTLLKCPLIEVTCDSVYQVNLLTPLYRIEHASIQRKFVITKDNQARNHDASKKEPC